MIKNTLYLLCIASVLFLGTPGYCKNPLHISYPDFAPFHYQNVDGRLEGIFFDIITEALGNRMDIQVIWTPYPWSRCQENVKFGKADAMITVPTPQRAVYTRTHHLPFYRKPLNLFTYASHPRLAAIRGISQLSDIKALGLSVVTYSTNGWHKKYVETLGIQTLESSFLRNVWRMLAHKRGDLVIEWPNGARPEIEQLGLEHQIIDTGITVSSMIFHLLIRKESEHVGLLDDFDGVIETMRRDGTIEAINLRYL